MSDCIRREAVLAWAYDIQTMDSERNVYTHKVVDAEYIEQLPSVEPERAKGKWVHMVGFWECNQCHAEYTDMPTCMGKVIYEYCPMCGAKMGEPQESEDKE